MVADKPRPKVEADLEDVIFLKSQISISNLGIIGILRAGDAL